MSSPIICSTCSTEYNTQPAKCDNCGYPFLGDDSAKSKFVASQIIKRGSMGETKDRLQVSRNLLFAMSGFNLVVTARFFFRYGMDFTFIANLIITLTFLFFAFYIRRKPLISVVIPLILLICFYSLQAISGMFILLHGIIWKSAFIVILSYSLVGIIKSERIKKESKYLADQDYK